MNTKTALLVIYNHRFDRNIERVRKLYEGRFSHIETIPMNPKYLAHHYNKYTYPIQDKNTRNMITGLKNHLAVEHFYFTGRFADWEYYNMDVAMGAAIDLCKNL